MGKKATIAKYGILAAIVIGAAGVGGHFAALQYQETMAVVQQKKDAQAAERKAQRLEKEAREKARHPQKKSAVGDADALDEAGTLTQEMEKKDLGNGQVLYSYAAPTSDGVYIVPYIIKSENRVLFYVSVRHLGTTPQGFPGVDVLTDEETRYEFRPEAQQVTTTPWEGGGITEQFDEQVNARTLKALRVIGDAAGGAKIVFPREGGSNDDRMLTATECTQIGHMVELFDLWRKQK